MTISLAILQFAAATIGNAVAPDIELRARVQAKQVTVIESGEARLEVSADPALNEDVTITQVPPRDGPQPRKRAIRNLDLTIVGSATLADPGLGGAPAPEAGDGAARAADVDPPG